jgi:hypothetical protein
MCRFSKEIEASTSQEDGFDLKRRTLEQLWGADGTQSEESAPLPSPAPSTSITTTKITSSTLSLSNEIENLIKWNREKSNLL